MKHDLAKDSGGSVDMSAWDGDTHAGPKCIRCGEMWCISCDPARVDEECEGVDLTTRVLVSISWPGKGETYDDRQVISAKATLSPGDAYMIGGDRRAVELRLQAAVGEVITDWRKVR